MTGTNENNSTSKSEVLPAEPTDAMLGLELEGYWEAEYLRTGNPLYVWRALASINKLTELRAEYFRNPPAIPNAIPAWCIQYLMEVSERVSDLTLFLDDRIRPQEPQAEWEWIANPTLSPAEAASRLTDALGIDWTTFTKFKTNEKQIHISLDFARLRADGLSAKDATERIMERYEIEDERTVRRYVRNARGAGKTSP